MDNNADGNRKDPLKVSKTILDSIVEEMVIEAGFYEVRHTLKKIQVYNRDGVVCEDIGIRVEDYVAGRVRERIGESRAVEVVVVSDPIDRRGFYLGDISRLLKGKTSDSNSEAA